MEMVIPHVEDFQLTGDGAAEAWGRAPWQTLTRVGGGGATFTSRCKALWSDSGFYALFDCEDRRLTCTLTADGVDLYNEDVVELFLWPASGDARAQAVYFEYELSPLGYELAIMVPHHQGRFHGWLPWHGDGARSIRRATAVRGGAKSAHAPVTGWSAECFIPFALLQGLDRCPPTRGTRWKGNFYRIDYDHDPASHWAWSPAVGANFHTIAGFGELVFGD